MGAVDALAAVHLADCNAIFGNGLHFGGVGAHQSNIMVLGQVAAEQQPHRAGTNDCNFHLRCSFVAVFLLFLLYKGTAQFGKNC